jgi:hypothetical protein
MKEFILSGRKSCPGHKNNVRVRGEFEKNERVTSVLSKLFNNFDNIFTFKTSTGN